MAIHSMAGHHISLGCSVTALVVMASNISVQCDQMETQTVPNQNMSHYQSHHEMFCPYAMHTHMHT